MQQHLQASRSLLTAMSVSLLILFWLILHAKLSSMLADTMFFLTVSVVSVLMYSIAVRLSLQAVRWGAGILAFAHIILIGLSFDYIGASSWENGLFHLDAAVLLAITISFWLATALVTQRSVLAASVLPAQVLSSVAGLYTLTYVWLLLHSILTNSVATTFSLITYTVIGLALFIYGRVKENQFIKIWGAVLLCGVVLRLLFVEIWALSLTMRIVTFFVVGILLISTAFIGRKKD